MAKDKLKIKNQKHYCYLITNLINDKVYVGTTYKDIKIRFKEHVKVSRFKNNNKKMPLQLAIQKYGADNFVVTLLSEFPDYDSAYKAEIEYIKKYSSYKHGYNCSFGGDTGPINIKYSTEIIIKILEDFCNGMSLNNISKKYNVKKYTVFDITRLRISNTHQVPLELLQKLNKIKSSFKKKKRVTKNQIIEIINSYLAGETMTQISDKYKLSLNNIWNILHRKTWIKINIDKNLEDQLKLKLSH